jgi:hypothetical protein
VAESAESEFLAEARSRGEPLSPTKTSSRAVAEEVDSKSLPAMEDLVKRIPPDIRTILEELFRAKFISVRKLPKSALKI